MKLVIAHADPQGMDALALLHEASIDARALYPELFTGSSRPPTNGPLAERGVHVVASVDNEPLACGALHPIDEATAEVRRIYVHRDHRRQGLGRKLIEYLAGEADRIGYSRLVLETGCRQMPAMRLYERCGFRRIPSFGRHVDDPTSISYERMLVDDCQRQAAAPDAARTPARP